MVSIIYFYIPSDLPLQMLQPIYSTYMEKPLKDAAEQAAHQAMNSAITIKGNNNCKPAKT